jgi:hypothetical protein
MPLLSFLASYLLTFLASTLPLAPVSAHLPSELELSWVELMLWPTASRLIRLGVGHPFGAHDQILLFLFFWRTIALPFVLGRPLWRENGSVICSAICQWSESRRTHNYTSHSLIRDRWVPFPPHVTTCRDYGESILTCLHMGILLSNNAQTARKMSLGPCKKHRYSVTYSGHTW